MLEMMVLVLCKALFCHEFRIIHLFAAIETNLIVHSHDILNYIGTHHVDVEVASDNAHVISTMTLMLSMMKALRLLEN